MGSAHRWPTRLHWWMTQLMSWSTNQLPSTSTQPRFGHGRPPGSPRIFRSTSIWTRHRSIYKQKKQRKRKLKPLLVLSASSISFPPQSPSSNSLSPSAAPPLLLHLVSFPAWRTSACLLLLPSCWPAALLEKHRSPRRGPSPHRTCARPLSVSSLVCPGPSSPLPHLAFLSLPSQRAHYSEFLLPICTYTPMGPRFLL